MKLITQRSFTVIKKETQILRSSIIIEMRVFPSFKKLIFILITIFQKLQFVIFVCVCKSKPFSYKF